MGLSRKHFIKNTAWTMAGLSLFPGMLKAARSSGSALWAAGTLSFKNVRLETGFVYEGNKVVATETGLFYLEVQQGRITKIAANQPDAGAMDAGGMLMLPAFKDMHIHLDKTLYGAPWQAPRKRKGGIREMIALEQQILPELLADSTGKAEKLIALLQSKGSSFARSHVNIEPTSGLRALAHLQEALERHKNDFSAELVAFPQHGVYYTDTAPLMREAARMDIDFIGGLDPYTVDGAIERTIDFTVQLALDHHKGIDIHLHERGESGRKTVRYLMDKVMENPELKGKTFLSHCFVLASLEAKEQEDIAARLSEAGIGIVSTIPIGKGVMPIPVLYKHGVTLLTGNDSIVDHWSTFGTGSVLEKANYAAQLYGYQTEYQLSRSLKLATGGTLPLDDKGRRQWPLTGDPADFVFIKASCSAEAVSRISPVASLVHKGNIVFG